MVQAAFLLVAACWLCACFSTAPPSARRGRAESHQWTRAAVAFPASARSLYKPARTERRSLWMSPPSHKALRAPTTTAPPNTKSPVPRSSAERVVTLVDSRPPMRPVLRARSLPGPSPALGGLQCATGFDPPCATRPREEVLPRAWWCGARGHSAPYPGGTSHTEIAPAPLVTKPRPDPGERPTTPLCAARPAARLPGAPGPRPYLSPVPGPVLPGPGGTGPRTPTGERARRVPQPPGAPAPDHRR